MACWMDNPNNRARYGRPFGELCTRVRMMTGETVNGISACWGLISEMTDDFEAECKRCEHLDINLTKEVCDG